MGSRRTSLLLLALLGLGIATLHVPSVGALTPSCPVPRESVPDVVAWVHDFVVGTDRQLGINGKNAGYDIPSSRQVSRFLRGFRQAAAGDVLAACETLAPLGYWVSTVVDQEADPDRTYVSLREMPDEEGTYDHAWGLYLIADDTSAPVAPVAVQVPHACPTTPAGSCERGDAGTEIVGAQVFRASGARYLFVNGASRNAIGVLGNCDGSNTPPNCPSDVAHNTATMFAKVNEAALDDPEIRTVYQPHGWSKSKHPNLTCGRTACDAVVSNGRRTNVAPFPSPDAERVATALGDQGFLVCLYPRDCRELGAGNNVERRAAERAGKRFVSVEVESVINRDADHRNRRFALANAVAQALRTP